MQFFLLKNLTANLTLSMITEKEGYPSSSLRPNISKFEMYLQDKLYAVQSMNELFSLHSSGQ